MRNAAGEVRVEERRRSSIWLSMSLKQLDSIYTVDNVLLSEILCGWEKVFTNGQCAIIYGNILQIYT